MATVRKLILMISIIGLVLATTACRGDAGPAGEQGPPGPQGPAGPAGPGADVASVVEQIREDSTASLSMAPAKYDAAEYTKYFVKEAIRRYDAEGLDATVGYYNTPESVDGQWYMFILDQNGVMLAHAANPNFVGRPSAEVDGPNAYPAGDAVAAVADEDGEWFSYAFPNPALGVVQVKHSWMVEYDGMTFGSGWYERGPSKSDNPAYTQAFVERAINLYNAVGRDATVEYYNTKESVDDQWYVFIIDEDGYTIGHHNPMFLGRDPSLRVDSTGYFYGDDLLGTPESGRWVQYVFENPDTGGERRKHTWAVLHDGLIFASGWYQ